MEQSAILLFQKAVTDMISENQEYINQTILSGTNKDMSTEQLCARMIANCLQLSTQLSTLFVLDFLKEQEVISLNEREIQKTLLTLLSSHQED